MVNWLLKTGCLICSDRTDCCYKKNSAWEAKGGGEFYSTKRNKAAERT